MQKKRFRLKKKYRRLLLYIVIFIVLVLIGVDRYKLYKYHQTDEYKLLKVGYKDNEVETFLKNLNDKQIDTLINSKKKDYVISIMTQKYFLTKNYDKYLNYYEKNSDKSFSDIVAIVNVGADKDWYQDNKETDISKGILTLTNKFNHLPKDYDPGEIKKFSVSYAYGEVSAEENTYNAFIEMAKTAKAEDITLVVTSGYRTYEKQDSLYSDYYKRKGQEYADTYASRPGFSEYETGYALELLNGEASKEWMNNHAHEYGFILRYEEGKEYLTGYKADSRHYRYIGVEAAKKIKDEGITFDEYYAYYLDK